MSFKCKVRISKVFCAGVLINVETSFMPFFHLITGFLIARFGMHLAWKIHLRVRVLFVAA
ncbi:Hypothetical protein P9303_29901 [Prochlorococcus marinus str. MIT 9303]|uniref:Uncharacterized protein n=1 Tax=Prochlorococcus marinus (strain MIT 9303) TaxID=59922 RepID=A2CE10_PROM3|nr:Hypothetical protein P9303_29901 [Prochlorococcus marinus str. MIT 9303]